MDARVRLMQRWLLSALLLVLSQSLPGASFSPVAARAEADQPAAVTAVNEAELVYIDSQDEKIRVLDTHQVGTNPLVQWVSPTGGWRAIDVGDFNADGDMEIVAVGGGGTDSGQLGTLAIFDPVVTTGAAGLPQINGIPWRLLHERRLPGRPNLVKAGNFDPNLPGDEILFGYLLNEDVPVDDETDIYRFTIIKSSIPNPDGSNWQDHISAKDEGAEWDFVTSGDFGDGGADEIVLLEEDGGEINVFKIAAGWQRIFDNSSTSVPYRSAAIGDYYPGGFKELLTSRKANTSVATLITYLYTPGSSDGLNFHAGIDNEEKIQPYPRFVWYADVDGNGDKELFLLRREQDPRLASRDFQRSVPQLDRNLDSDDGYRVGVGGDFDGDGREEVAIMRNTNLRIYDLENNAWGDANYGLSADTSFLRAGDLDSAGFSAGPRFALRNVDPAKIAGSLEPNATGSTVAYELINAGNSDTLFFTYTLPQSAPWVTITLDKTSASADNPARIFVSFDATGLLPGTYTSNLTIDGSNQGIVNDPFVIPVVLTVEPARIDPSPTVASFIYFPCGEGAASEQRIILSGTRDVHYEAAVVARPVFQEIIAALTGPIMAVEFAADGQATFSDGLGNRKTVLLPARAELSASAANLVDWPSTASWVSAQSETAVLPDIVTVSVDPAELTATYQEAVLVIVGDASAGNNPTNVRLVGITTLCAKDQSFLPYLARR